MPPTAESIRKALRAVKDPELNLNIMDIGLVYDVEVDDSGDVRVEMTLTSPGCPAGAEIIGDVKRVVGDMEGVRAVEVELVREPAAVTPRTARRPFPAAASVAARESPPFPPESSG
jgi:metal-sulfur cluster biosynthetic enzyme